LSIGKIPHEIKVVDLSKGKHKAEDFLKVNPRGSVPSITDGDFSLGESNAILRYLFATRDLPEHLYPKDPEVRGHVDMWMDYA